MPLKQFQGFVVVCSNLSSNGRQKVREICQENVMQASQLFIPRAVSKKRHTAPSAVKVTQPSCSITSTQSTSHLSRVTVVNAEESQRQRENEYLPVATNFSLSNTDSPGEVVESNSYAQLSILKAIYIQKNAPYVAVGSMSSRRRVPFYQRFNQPLTEQIAARVPTTAGQAIRSYCTDTHLRSVQDMQVQPALSHVKPDFGPRRWEYTEIGELHRRRGLKGKGIDFTIMSYNILAQTLLEDNYYLYTGCQPKLLEWDFRKQHLLNELLYHSPDVICLQEVQESHYHNHFYPELKHQGYEGHYVKRTGNKYDGCATFYKTNKFQLETVIPVKYRREEAGGVLDRDNVALILKLQPHSQYGSTDKHLCIANTHLLFNPRRGDIKLAQLMLLLAELDKCTKNKPQSRCMDSNVIMCGDFNSEPHSDIYKLLQMGSLKYEGLLCRQISGEKEGMNSGRNIYLQKDFFPVALGVSDECRYIPQASTSAAQSQASSHRQHQQGSGRLRHSFSFYSVYNHKIWRDRNRHSYDREVTTHHSKACCTVDYIFYGILDKEFRINRGEVQTRNVRESDLNLLAKYRLVTSTEMRQLGSMPNRKFASDHLSLVAKFFLRL